MRKLLMLLFVVAIALPSCKKENYNAAPSKIRISSITVKSYPSSSTGSDIFLKFGKGNAVLLNSYETYDNSNSSTSYRFDFGNFQISDIHSTHFIELWNQNLFTEDYIAGLNFVPWQGERSEQFSLDAGGLEVVVVASYID